MPFIRIPGRPGRFFVSNALPESLRKYACLGCRQCQWCSDERCRPCRADAAKRDDLAARPVEDVAR